MTSTDGRSPFSLLLHLAGDEEQLGIFSKQSLIESWLAAERALALAQAEHGVISRDDADAIVAAARLCNVDDETLWKTARRVGYPILGLVREVCAGLPAGPDGRVHFGATTQDIMDTGLALQMARSLAALDRALGRLGDALAGRVAEHAGTVMAARTHAQQAVPTTFGATLGTLLAQFTRQRERLAQAAPRIALVSLFGAGGTAAALGPRSAEIRATVADLLGLHHTDVPWHVDRDGVAEFGWLCTTVTATCAKLARNVVDLSRTEIGEVFEPFESHRGASSTMPQKVNPISSEIVIGLAGTAGALTSSLARLQEAGHERAAGEWQIEWQVVPQLAVLAGTALSETLIIVEGLRVDAGRMRANLELDGGLAMAEAQMISLAEAMGREHAHDLVYEAAIRARTTGRTLAEVLPEVADEKGKRDVLPKTLIDADAYVGEAGRIADAAVRGWSAVPALSLVDTPLPELASRAP
ncbi:lyase family protein [Pseudonocardia cypriaca]|uniref:3-carboxy-cis,cis-muconate cycloisomerase n=1 Tax=Pseudonocardia cypriaca TaxID=882449 RepID=A0A543FSZ7_9PSEU|nr:lyase family protein [Pseudonocardia cypriaca]TQM36969.1 3-carboxy-cis,cis-muconate cycloisomerase [Pseudonocardia cypriaca]